MREFSLASIALLVALTSVGGPSPRRLSVEKMPIDIPAGGQKPVDRYLRVLSYNTFLRPAPVSWGDQTGCRARRIARRLAGESNGRDLVTLTETFDQRLTAQMGDILQDRFPYQLHSRPRGRGLRTNGGLTLLSRYPIEHWDARPFDQCSGPFSNCLATKGFLWALVRVSSRLKVNIITTHTNAGGDPPDRRVRGGQFDQLRRYINSNPFLKRWPTVLTGDLNVNGIRWEWRDPQTNVLSEYAAAMARLGHTCIRCTSAACAEQCSAVPIDTFRQSRGPWSYDAAGTSAVNTYNCLSQSLSPCADLNAADRWRSRMRLDYVMHFGSPQWVPAMSVRTVDASSDAFEDPTCHSKYLSDHRAVEATLEIRRSSSLNARANRPHRRSQ